MLFANAACLGVSGSGSGNDTSLYDPLDPGSRDSLQSGRREWKRAMPHRKRRLLLHIIVWKAAKREKNGCRRDRDTACLTANFSGLSFFSLSLQRSFMTWSLRRIAGVARLYSTKGAGADRNTLYAETHIERIVSIVAACIVENHSTFAAATICTRETARRNISTA